MSINPNVAISSQSTATQTKCITVAFAPITVTATGAGLTYQWFSNSSNNNSGGTSLAAADGAQTNSYTPQSTAAGTLYYYCIVSGTCGSAVTSVVSGAFTTNPNMAISSQSTATQTKCITVAFTPITVTATGAGLTYQWYSNSLNNNSGGTSLAATNGAQTNSYTPQSTVAGTLYYYCIVSGTCGSAVTSLVSGAFITNPPAPVTLGAITQPANKCASLTGNIFSIGAVAGAISYTWSVTGTGWSVTAGGTTTSATITIGSGVGTVSVTATNACGTSSASTTGNITPTTAPATPGTITQPANICASSVGNTFYIGAVPGATSYTWSVTGTGWSVTAGGTTTSATITIGSGVGTVSVAATNVCGTSSASTTGNITPTTVPAGLSYTVSSTSYCLGAVITTNSASLTTSGSPAATYSVSPALPAGLSLNNSTGAITGAPTVSVAATDYTVTASNTCGNTTVMLNITVSPTTVGGTASSSQTICSGTSPADITLTGSTGTSSSKITLTASGGGIEWQVSSNNSTYAAISGATATTLTSAQMGVLTATRYYRALVSGGVCSSAYSTVVTVTVNALPTAPSAGMPTQPCVAATGSVVLSGLPAGTWTLNPGAITGNTESVTVLGLSAGTYNFTVTNATGCTSLASDNVGIIAPVTATWNVDIVTGIRAWTNGPPTIEKALIFNGDYNSLTDTNDTVVAGCSCEVNPGAAVVFTDGKSLKITNKVTVLGTGTAAGTLTLENNASLVQVNDVANSGNIIMHRTANIRLNDYVYWSSPVVGFPVTSLSPSTPANVIWKWQPTVANTNGSYGNWQNANENMGIAKGYIVRGPSGFNNTIKQNFTASFTGVPNNGIYTPTISRGTLTVPTTGTNGILVTPYDDNWNLVGNPYPSAIKALDFLYANSNIAGFVNLWTHGTLPGAAPNPFYGSFVYNYTANDYITYNATGTTSGPFGFNGYIGAGQGFFVMMKDGAATTQTITFNNSMRSISYDNAQFCRSSTSGLFDGTEKHSIWLDLISSTNAVNRMLVGYVAGATIERDRLYDAVTKVDNNQNFYSLLGNEPFKIQGRPVPFDANDQVQLGVKLPASGNYTIALGATVGLFQGVDYPIFLEDKQLNVIHDLKQAPYSFISEAGTFDNRFVLRYTKISLGNNDFNTIDNSVVVAVANQEIHIKSLLEPIKDISVYDVLGRLIFKENNVNTTEFSIQNLVLNQQALIIKIVIANGQNLSKKIIL